MEYALLFNLFGLKPSSIYVAVSHFCYIGGTLHSVTSRNLNVTHTHSLEGETSCLDSQIRLASITNPGLFGAS
jgi:hypothetical protein